LALFAATSVGAARLGMGGATGAGFAAINANATNGNANRACFNSSLPYHLGACATALLSLA